MNTIKIGQKGKDVKAVQKLLKELNFYSGKIDGDFGPKTKKSVEDYQTKNDLSVDGEIGKNTFKQMGKDGLFIPKLIKTTLSSMYDSMVIRKSFVDQAEYEANQILKNRHKYKLAEKETGVLWKVIGIIHQLEGGGSFKTHLHNGDPLTTRTRQIPRGRPKKGSPPFSWLESAIDALEYDGLTSVKIWDNQTILDRLERYNGLGYRKRGKNSPYLWSGSKHYTRGKYTSDGKYDSRAVSKQVGAALILKILG